jgi:hypothetical protein
MGWVVNATPRPLYPKGRSGTHCTHSVNKQEFRSALTGILRGEQWKFLTDVSRKPVGSNFKGQKIGCPRRQETPTIRCVISQNRADLVYFATEAWDRQKEFTLQSEYKAVRSTAFRWTTKRARTWSVPLVYGIQASRCNFLIRIKPGATL